MGWSAGIIHHKSRIHRNKLRYFIMLFFCCLLTPISLSLFLLDSIYHRWNQNSPQVNPTFSSSLSPPTLLNILTMISDTILQLLHIFFCSYDTWQSALGGSLTPTVSYRSSVCILVNIQKIKQITTSCLSLLKTMKCSIADPEAKGTYTRKTSWFFLI